MYVVVDEVSKSAVKEVLCLCSVRSAWNEREPFCVCPQIIGQAICDSPRLGYFQALLPRLTTTFTRLPHRGHVLAQCWKTRGRGVITGQLLIQHGTKVLTVQPTISKTCPPETPHSMSESHVYTAWSPASATRRIGTSWSTRVSTRLVPPLSPCQITPPRAT